MGVVVDLSAVKAVNDAKRRKIKRNTPREQNESAVRPSAVRIVDEDVDSKGTHAEIRGRAADQRAMMELRSQEISDLGSATGGNTIFSILHQSLMTCRFCTSFISWSSSSLVTAS